MHAYQHARAPRLRRHRRHAALLALLPALLAAPLMAQETAAPEPDAPVQSSEPPPPGTSTPERRFEAATLRARDTELETLRRQLAEAKAETAALAERTAGLDQRVKEAETARAKSEEARGQAEQAKAGVEQSLKKAVEAKDRAERELTARAQEVLTLKEDLARAREESAALERRLAQVQDLKRENREREEALSRVETERKALEERLSALQQAREDAARQAQEREAALSREIANLRARLPTPEGGTLSADDARARAATAGKALLDALRGAGGRPTKDVRDAESQLFQAQMLLARTISAQSLYRVWPQDTLARVSLRVYGDGGRWKAIYKANAHVLDSPDHLTAGMTLVIP